MKLNSSTDGEWRYNIHLEVVLNVGFIPSHFIWTFICLMLSPLSSISLSGWNQIIFLFSLADWIFGTYLCVCGVNPETREKKKGWVWQLVEERDREWINVGTKKQCLIKTNIVARIEPHSWPVTFQGNFISINETLVLSSSQAWIERGAYICFLFVV